MEQKKNGIKKKKSLFKVWEDGNLNDGGLDARNRTGGCGDSSGNDAFPSHGEGRGGEGGVVRKRRRVKTFSDVAAVMKREANDWRQEVETRGRGELGSGGLCIIHPC